jgi:xanthine dehydrogenase accessory factor
MNDFFAKLDEIQKSGRFAAFCIVIETKGSSPRKAGAKMIVTSDGEYFGTVGGGNIEMTVIEEAKKICRQSSPVKLVLNLEEDAGMKCGGNIEIYIEPVVPLYELVIFGAGHIGKKVARYARDFGFKITLVDPREEIMSQFEKENYKLINQDYLSTAQSLGSNENTYLVVLTPKHEFDQELTGVLAKKPHRYLGMIGSARKVAASRKHYIDNNILNEQEISKIDMPIGIKFNAQTPEEIAISIVARLIDVKNSPY